MFLLSPFSSVWVVSVSDDFLKNLKKCLFAHDVFLMDGSEESHKNVFVFPRTFSTVLFGSDKNRTVGLVTFRHRNQALGSFGTRWGTGGLVDHQVLLSSSSSHSVCVSPHPQRLDLFPSQVKLKSDSSPKTFSSNRQEEIHIFSVLVLTAARTLWTATELLVSDII